MNNISILLISVDIIVLVIWISILSTKVSKLNAKVKVIEFFFKLQLDLNSKQAQLNEDIEKILKNIVDTFENDRED